MTITRHQPSKGIFGIFMVLALCSGGIGQKARHRVPLYPPAGKQSPIKVRGGAMTFYTSTSWKKVDSTSFCSAVKDTAEIGGNDLYEGNSEVDTETAIVPVGKAWSSITFFSYDQAGNVSRNGIIVTQMSSCAGIITPSVLIKLLNPIESNYYGKDLVDSVANRTYYTDNKRFRNHSPLCLIGDQDLCERIATVRIAFPSGPPKDLACPFGDCTVGIGKPE